MAGKDLSVYVNIGGRVASSLSAAVKQAEAKLSGLNRHFLAQAAAQKAAIRGVMESYRGLIGLAAAGGMAFSVKKFFGDGEELAHEIEKLREAGRSAKEVAEGIAKANETIGRLPTASLTGSIKLLNETTGAFGDYQHAVENLEFNSKLSAVLKNTAGSADPEHDIGSLIKALEIRGSASDPAKYRREAGELQRAMTFYGTRLKADDIYTFASNAPSGIKRLNERFLTKIAPSLIQEMGGEKAGTGLTAFQKVIQGGISDQEQAKAWVGLKMITGKAVKRDKKTHQIIGWRPGAMKDSALAMQDPLEFMEKDVLPALEKYGIDGKKVDTKDPEKLGNALKLLFKKERSNAFAQAIGTLVDRTRLKKDEGLIGKVMTTDKAYDSAILNDPKMASFAIHEAMKNIGASLTLPMMKPFAQMMISIARSINKLSQVLMDHPETAKRIAGIGMALGIWTALRLANLALGVTATARAIAYLSAAAVTGTAAKLIGLARGIVAVSAAATLGAVARVRAFGGALMALALFPARLPNLLRSTALAITMLGVGGSLRMAAAGLVGLGVAALRFPVTALRAIGLAMWGLVANPVGAVVTAIVVALTSLGVWVYNNWDGLKSFFVAFGEVFTKNLGPGPAKAVSGIVDALRSVWDWFSKILSPLDESGAKWVAWGASAGRAAASIVNALASVPKMIADLLTNFDWSSVGSAIGGAIKGGIGRVGSSIGGAAVDAWGAVKGGASALKDRLFGGSIPGRYAGGPVSAGSPYLVGERGPELFVPSGSGRIVPNNALRPSVDVSAVSRTRALAGQTGMALHEALDATRMPIVDTSSIDAAMTKVASLGGSLNGLGGGGLGGGLGGGAGAGGGGGVRVDGSVPTGNFAGLGHIASQAERAAYIKEAAKARGINGDVALTVAKREGFGKYVGDYGTSFGDFQLHTGGRGPRGMRVGGLGDIAMRQGINIHDPRTWKRQVDFALDNAKRSGWGAWHGWRGSRWAGIRGVRATGGPVGGGLPYLVGERGPEVFTPGESGRIASNREIARLTDPSAVAGLRKSGADVSVMHTRGDTHYSPSFVIHGARNPEETKRQVESHFWDLVRQAERDQAGSLSD